MHQKPEMCFHIEETEEKKLDPGCSYLFSESDETSDELNEYSEEQIDAETPNQEATDSSTDEELQTESHIQTLFMLLFQLISALFGLIDGIDRKINPPQQPKTHAPKTHKAPKKPSGPIIRELDDFDESSGEEESADCRRFVYRNYWYEQDHINFTRNPNQPGFIYESFLKKFTWKDIGHIGTNYSMIFDTEYMCYQEFNQFAQFCKKLKFGFTRDGKQTRFIYNVLMGNIKYKNDDDTVKAIYRSYRQRDLSNLRWHEVHEDGILTKHLTTEGEYGVKMNGKHQANFWTLKLIRLMIGFVPVLRRSIRHIFERTVFDFNDPDAKNAFIVNILMNDTKFYMYFRVLNWISKKLMHVLIQNCLEYSHICNEKATIENEYGIIPECIFMSEYFEGFLGENIGIGWVKIDEEYFRFFEINKNRNDLQIKHICPLGWQKYYIGQYGLDTVMFKYDWQTENVIWEKDAGMLLYKKEIVLEIDEIKVGTFGDDDEKDDDLFHIYAMRYDGIDDIYCNQPSFSNGKYKNLGYMYAHFKNENNIFSDALAKLKGKNVGEFVFIPWIIHSNSHDNDDEFNETLIAYLMLEHCYNKYCNDGDENCNEFKLLVAEIINNSENKDIKKEMNNLKKKKKINKYFKPLIKSRKNELFQKAKKRGVVPKIKGNKNKNKRNKRNKTNKKQSIIDGKVKEYMNEWMGKQKIKYRHYLNMVNDLGTHLQFDENIKTIRRKGSHAAIHFGKGHGAIPLIPRPHAKQGTSVSLFIVKKWLKTYISKDK